MPVRGTDNAVKGTDNAVKGTDNAVRRAENANAAKPTALRGAQVFDRQKTGVISAQDLRHLFTKLGEKMEDAEVPQKNPPSDTPVS